MLQFHVHSLDSQYLPHITSDAFISWSCLVDRLPNFELVSFGVVSMSCRVNFHLVRSALQYSACGNFICLLFIFADQVFIDPTFSGIFVCGPLQSFVVNVCTRILIFFLSIKAWEEKSLPKSHLGWFFSVFGEGKATIQNI